VKSIVAKMNTMLEFAVNLPLSAPISASQRNCMVDQVLLLHGNTGVLGHHLLRDTCEDRNAIVSMPSIVN
jgi:hypothetical protein